ncbi:protein Aster-B-like isoform X2 [Actinia tenebrosa]|uniref:Protein Aster-B-like isoform X2 n=1 Tax=Actinia tenebrosa TaxID=6105 RepID=A0A6P8IJR3_ACTTE|nr:protein Aster-B-like isoform X2 [Actinia tenebrosa]
MRMTQITWKNVKKSKSIVLMKKMRHKIKRKASPTSHEDESSSLNNAELDSLSLGSQELEDIEERSTNRSQSIAKSLKSRIRDLSPSRKTPSPKPERKIKKAKTPTKLPKSPAGWLPASFNQMFSSYKSKSGDFRRLFKDLPDSEQLIVDYSCALQRDILVHGRLYISQNWLCFYANIFGWETFVTIKCTDITSIRKEKTALVIPNAVQINTESEKYFFASFISRDTAFTVLFRIWQNALLDQPLTPSELIHMVGKYVESDKEDSDDSDKDLSSEDSDLSGGEEEDDEPEDVDDDDFDEILTDDEVTKQDDEDKENKADNSAFKPVGNSALTTAPELSITPPSPTQLKKSENGNTSEGSSVTHRKKRSPSPVSKGSDIKSLLKSMRKDKYKLSDTEETTMKHIKESSDMDEEGSVSEFLEEESKEPHNCMCDKHLAIEMLNEVWPLSVDDLYGLLFTESNFYKKLQKHRKTKDLVFKPWTKSDDGQHRTITYTIALNYSIGPKTSPTTEAQHCFKGSVPGKVYIVQAVVNNEGIPYGDSFSVVTRYCITKCTDKSCRLRITSEIKYKKSVWGFVKNMIEKNASDGLKEYFTFLGESLRKETHTDQTTKRRRTSPGRRHKRNRSLKSREDILPSPSSTSLSDKASQNLPLWKRTVSGLLSVRSSFPSMKTESKFALAIAILLACLLALNMFLTGRLLALERGTQMRMDWPRDLENLPTDAKEWAQMLQQQKEMHEKEMERWREILSTSIKLMNQVQDSLSELNKELSH